MSQLYAFCMQQYMLCKGSCSMRFGVQHVSHLGDNHALRFVTTALGGCQEVLHHYKRANVCGLL